LGGEILRNLTRMFVRMRLLVAQFQLLNNSADFNKTLTLYYAIQGRCKYVT
jgi:hypothetical protein